ncbi:DUF1430 domain-containing protein [Streptococcus halichoeri]|uniref:DUF1430 domain-containing protein n=1 Tax=Streptococcus halichoeri TaxID=254785 RepID=UPI001C8EA228|nr:DUF1430 domain-containing protein [Streptococcus halichoeri]
MYHNFKRALILFSFLLLSVIGTLFIKTHESELFGGFRDIIVVEKSTVVFPKELSHFVREKRLILARRIVEPLNNETGQLQNTYVPIGARQLPSLLKQQKANFFKAVSESTTIIYRVDMLDNIAVLPTKQKSSKYEPTADLTSNVIYVNNNYVKETGLQLSKAARGFMSEMKTYDKMILIPNMQKRHFHVLKQQWTYFEERGFLPKDATFKNPHPNARINAFLYDGGDVFTYPVYSTIGRRCSNVASVKDPIIIVEKPNFEELSTATLLVNNPKTVIEMIQKHELTALFGSLTNGRLSIETRMTSMLTQKVMLIISTGISTLTSFLLFLLMNRVYFYQGRRVHFLERLAGQGLVAIHQKYLLTLCMSYVLLGLVTFFLGYSYTVATVPILYLSLLLLLFSCQLAREKRVHRDYLKGQ